MPNAFIAQTREEMDWRKFHIPKNSANPEMAKKVHQIQRGDDQADPDFRLFRLAFKY